MKWRKTNSKRPHNIIVFPSCNFLNQGIEYISPYRLHKVELLFFREVSKQKKIIDIFVIYFGSQKSWS